MIKEKINIEEVLKLAIKEFIKIKPNNNSKSYKTIPEEIKESYRKIGVSDAEIEGIYKTVSKEYDKPQDIYIYCGEAEAVKKYKGLLNRLILGDKPLRYHRLHTYLLKNGQLIEINKNIEAPAPPKDFERFKDGPLWPAGTIDIWIDKSKKELHYGWHMGPLYEGEDVYSIKENKNTYEFCYDRKLWIS